MQYRNPEGQVARWLEILSAYQMNIVHRPGRMHRNADGMSRIQCKQCGMFDEATEEIETTEQSGEGLVSQVTESEELNLRTAQEQDEDIMMVKQWIASNRKPERKEIAGESFFVKSLISQWERLKIENGILVRRWDVLGTDEVRWQAVVPLTHRRIVLKYSHDNRASGHLGIMKTVSKIRQGYFWPGLQNDVKSYVAGCDFCSRRKEPLKTKRAPMELERSGFPMERIAIDILGELPLTERGNKYIVVIGDYFTKWTECHAMPNMEASTVARILIEQVVSRFGIPYIIHSDQGRQFEGKLFTEMCTMLQITKTRTTPYHPKSDGMVERFNKTLVTMLSAYVNENHTDWDEQLQYVMMAYRATEHETTGLTPNMCMLGRETTCPLDIMFEMPPPVKNIPHNDWVWKLQEKLESAHKLVRQNTERGMKRQKRYHDDSLSYETFEVGDKVYVFFAVKKVGCSSKFTCYWKGPFEVSRKLSRSLYVVNCGRRRTLQVIHCDRMRKAKRQILAGEDIADITGNENSDTEEQNIIENDSVWMGEDIPIFNEYNDYEIDFGRGKRNKQSPYWMKDYVLSIFRSNMAKTKTTRRKANQRCETCQETFNNAATLKYHVLTTHLGEYGCEPCKKTFTKRFFYNKHLKSRHANEESETEKDSEEPKKSSPVEHVKVSEKVPEPIKITEPVKQQVDAICSTELKKHCEINNKTYSSSNSGDEVSEDAVSESEESSWGNIEEIELIESETSDMALPLFAPQKRKIENVVSKRTENEVDSLSTKKVEKSSDNNNNCIVEKAIMNPHKEEKDSGDRCPPVDNQGNNDKARREDERIVQDIYSGRIYTKPTRPKPVFAPPRKQAEDSAKKEDRVDSDSDMDEITITIKAGAKKRLKLKLPCGELKLDFEMTK